MATEIISPATYGEIVQAAVKYRSTNRGRNYDEAYLKVCTLEFRGALRDNDAKAFLALRSFLRRFRVRKAASAKPEEVKAAVWKAADTLGMVLDWELGNDLLGQKELGQIKAAFDELVAVDRIGPVTASKILGVINPEIFVMWDSRIIKNHFPSLRHNTYPATGYHYSRFLLKMEIRAQRVLSDAYHAHGIENPADHLSALLQLPVPFTLSKFIDEYNFVNTR